MSFIINPDSGEQITKGYHEIYEKNGRLFGSIGSSEEEIDLSVSKKVSKLLERVDKKTPTIGMY